MLFVLFGSLETSARVGCSRQDGTMGRRCDCGEVPAEVEWGGDRKGRPILCSTYAWRYIASGTVEGAEAESGPSSHLELDEVIVCLLINLEFRLTHQFIG